MADTASPASPPSSHVLRTLAAVPVHACVLDLGCGTGVHTDALARLGFDVWACDADEAAITAARARVADALGAEEAAKRVTRASPAALGYADDFFDWVVAHGTFDSADSAADLKEQLAETRRVLKPGGWVIVAFRRDRVGNDLTPETLSKLMAEAGLAEAETPAEADESGLPVVRGIYRRVDPTTPI